MVKKFLCWIGWHAWEHCQSNEMCDKEVRKCKCCMVTYCKVNHQWVQCDCKKNDCKWSFGCGFK